MKVNKNKKYELIVTSTRTIIQQKRKVVSLAKQYKRDKNKNWKREM